MVNEPMTKPDYGVPDEETPEWAERDFAYARRRDGSLAGPDLFVKYAPVDLREALHAPKNACDPAMAFTLRHVEVALAEMNKG